LGLLETKTPEVLEGPHAIKLTIIVFLVDLFYPCLFA